MGQCYEQFSLEERCTLSRLSQAGKTSRQIAAAMGRAPSTIARELKHDSGTQVGDQPAYAEQSVCFVAIIALREIAFTTKLRLRSSAVNCCT